MKRRNTEPHMQLPLASTTGSSTCHVPNSAPPVGHVAVAASSQVPTRNLVDLCDSPTHATPVWLHGYTLVELHMSATYVTLQHMLLLYDYIGLL